MQIIITMAGLGQRFQAQGYTQPKPLVSVLNKPAIFYLMQSFSASWKLFFVLGEHLKKTELESVIKSIRPDAVIIYTTHSARGPIDTVLAAIPYLNKTESVSVSYGDYALIWQPGDFEKFVNESKCDSAIISYRGFHPTYLGPNTYAHMQVDDVSNKILKIQEKKLFGTDIEKEWTSAGFYFFKSVSLLQQGLELQLKNNLKYGNEFYTSLAIQALMDEALEKAIPLNVLNYQISHFIQMGTPEDIELIEKWAQIFKLSPVIDVGPSQSEINFKKYWEHIFKIFGF